MQINYSPGRMTFGLLPEPEGRSSSFVVSTVVNGLILLLMFLMGMMAKHEILHQYEQTELIFPTNPAPQPVKMKQPAPQPAPPPMKVHEVHMQAPKIAAPKPEFKPKPVELQAKLEAPMMRMQRPQIILRPEPKAAMTAAMPAQAPQVRASTAPVHLGETFGVTPNPNATRPATIAAIGNPYGGMNGPAVAPHGVVGSAGIGNGTRSGSNYGAVGRVASAGIPGATGTGGGGERYGHVGSAGIPGMASASVTRPVSAVPQVTSLEVLSKPPVRYTNQAKQAGVQGDVVLRVTFLASGRVIVEGVVHGLGYGLDQEAEREAQEIRFRPATRDGRAVNLTTNIIITFQLA
ncbi:MAG TPA: energy transducer TonB [Terracidiphilus sp.]|nr:energy transducer TonB [Terracidiphilus sp.]